MSSMPLAALSIRPPEQPDVLGEYGKALQIKNLAAQSQMIPGQQQLQQQQIQSGQLSIQQQQQQLKDQQAFTAALQSWDGKDIEEIPGLILKHGGSALAVFGAKQQILEQKTKLATLDKDTLANEQSKNDFLLNSLKSATEGSDEGLAQRVQQAAQDAVQKGNLDPQHAQQIQQVLGSDPKTIRTQLGIIEKGLTGTASMLQAKARMKAAEKTPATEEPIGNVDQLNQAMQSRYQVLNPGQSLPPQFTLPPNANKSDFERIDKLMQATETAAGTKANQESINAARQGTQSLAEESKNQNRSDKSYQFSVTELGKLKTPVDQTAARLSKLQDTIAQNSPQADALIAPELLSVMSGGQGSGLRMNEAEISRVVGGRSNWESLKASINKWQLDPKAALSITPSQRQQIRSLIETVGTKITAKQQILDDAQNQLLGSEDPAIHRKAIADASTKLSAIDRGEQAGGAQGGGPNPQSNAASSANDPFAQFGGKKR